MAQSNAKSGLLLGVKPAAGVSTTKSGARSFVGFDGDGWDSWDDGDAWDSFADADGWDGDGWDGWDGDI
jgi:hypothetical protein